MKPLILILGLFSLISPAVAQKPLTNSRTSSNYTYIYPLREEYVKLFYSSGKRKLKEDALNNPVDSFLTDRPHALRLKPGNYLEVCAIKNELHYNLLQQRSAHLKILNNGQYLQFTATDLQGAEIKDAEIYLSRRRISYDPEKQLYSTGRIRRNKLLRIKYQGVTNFYKLTKNHENLYSYKQPFFKRLWFSVKRKANRLTGKNAYHYVAPYPGFIVFNKPLYRPGDTVKLKAYILEKRSKTPVKDSRLLVRLKEDEDDNGKIIGYVNAYRRGAFEFEFKLTDSLDLDLDDDYIVSLETLASAKYDLDKYDGDLEDREYLRKRTVYQSGRFHFEDYELKANRFTMRADKEVHSPGSPVSLYLRAEDENGLTVQDGRIGLILTNYGYSNFGEDKLFIPDTLWQHKVSLEPAGETKVVIPDSIFPKADIRFMVHATFLNSNNELREESKSLSFKQTDKEIKCDLDQDTLKIGYLIKGKNSPVPATLFITSTEGDTVDVKHVQLPYNEVPGPGRDVYIVNAGTVSETFKINTFQSQLSVTGYRNGDSLYIQASNPRKIEFWYTVFAGDKIIDQGKAKELDYKKLYRDKKSVSVLLNYFWGGEPAQQEAQIPYQDKILAIEVKQPLTVYPGQETKIEIDVKDAAGNPVEGADITGYSFTSKFEKVSLPFIPYLGRTYPLRKPASLISTADIEQNGVLKLNWQRWSREMGLDSIEYYKFTHPAGLYQLSESAPDSLTQIAPFVVKDGDILPVHILYIDEKPVYFSQTTHLHRYSFPVGPDAHKIRFRTRDMNITVDSIVVPKGAKCILSVNAGVNVNRSVKILKQPAKLSEYEAGLINKYLISVVHTFGEKFATLEQGDRLFLLNPPDSRTYYGYGDRTILTGPHQGFSARFELKGEQPVYFEPEPGYSFEFRPGLLKQRSLLQKYPFSLNLFLAGTEKPDYRQYPLTQKELNLMWQDFLDLRSHTTPLFSNDYLPDKGTGKLVIRVDTLRDGKIPFVKNVIIFKNDDPDFMRVFPGNTTSLQNYAPGKYRIFFLLKGNRYILQENVIIRANGTNFYSTGSEVEVHPADITSLKIAETIENRGNRNDAGTGGSNSPQILKETFNEKYLDNGTFTSEMSGFVYDKSDHSPLPGVIVKVKGLKYGAVTGLNGAFTLKVPSSGKLEIQFVGYESEEVSILPGSTINIYLMAAKQLLQEVVVVGYGGSKRQALTGAISIVSDQLAGRVAGVSIRGVSSAPSVNPLVVVDGVPVEGGMQNIDPSLIQEVTILKTEAATSLYGARGANGVILVSTKKKAGEAAPAGEQGQEAQQNLRKNFSDYAFWQPRLKTDGNGKASFRVTFPDDITSWRTFFIGMNDKKQTGFTEGRIKSFKPVSANFTSPLFAVRGDVFEPVGKVLNYTTDTVSLQRSFSFNGSVVKEGRMKVFNSLIDTFRVKAEGKDSLHFEYLISGPNNLFDGERRSVPLFERGVVETKGIFAALEKDTTFSPGFDEKYGKVTLRAEASVLPVLLEETGHLRKYEYLCNEQLASKLKGLLAEKKIRTVLNQPFNYEKEIKDLIKKLLEGRRREGTWGWWKDTNEELWISLHATEALLQAEEQGYKTQLDRQKLTDYLIYKLPSLSGADRLSGIDMLKKLGTKADYSELISEYEKQRSSKIKITEYEKLRFMLTRQSAGLPVSIDSLLKMKRSTMFGNTYWGEKGYRFFDNSIQLSLLAYRILKQDGKHEEVLSKIRNYFLEQRKDGQWRNTYESALILETILPDILKDGKRPEPASIVLSGEKNETVTSFPYTTTLDNSARLTISKKGGLPVYLTAYQQFFNTNPDKVNKDFGVNTWFEKDGDKISTLKGGQPILLKAEVAVRADADYVMIEVPVPAGCSYGDKEQSYSGDEVHREYFRNKVNIFCKKLKEGKYTYAIRLVPRYTGVYTLNPAKAEMMYFPVFFGREEMKKVLIK